jgi:hypothetical protein
MAKIAMVFVVRFLRMSFLFGGEGLLTDPHYFASSSVVTEAIALLTTSSLILSGGIRS